MAVCWSGTCKTIRHIHLLYCVLVVSLQTTAQGFNSREEVQLSETQRLSLQIDRIL